MAARPRSNHGRYSRSVNAPDQNLGSGGDGFARELWWRVEMIHAVTYFAPESAQAAEALGVKGFWRRYFGFRAAPLGRCSAAVVEAAFFGFAPSMVRQAVPEVWNLASPQSWIGARTEAARVALRRVAPSIERVASSEHIQRLADAASKPGGAGGRALFVANRDLAELADPVARLWQLCTTLREHRGDGHVAAWVATGLSAPEVAVLFVSDLVIPDEVLQPNRGWTNDEWLAARSSLVDKSLIDNNGVTARGAALRASVERTTDELAAERFMSLPADQRAEMLTALATPANEIADSGLIPFPNPMGLPRQL
jgi:hypothetical protein